MTLSKILNGDTQDRQLVAVRTLKASRDLVFNAWTDPGALAAWWGPKGFTNTFEIFEPEAGGQWKYVMHGPNGGNYKNESWFVELSRERIIVHHVSPPHFHLVASFEELSPDETRIIFRQVFDTVEECDKVRSFAVESNEQNLDRLESILGQMRGETKFSFYRQFASGPQQLFEAWSNAEELKKWWGPHLFTNPVCETDPRPGGRLTIHMQAPDGMIFPMQGTYQQVEEPNLLVFCTSAFPDENGVDQFESLNTVSIKENNEGTELQLTVLVLKTSPVADEVLDGMEEGWDQSLDKLAKLLE